MKAKRILAVLLSAAVLSASTVVGTALTVQRIPLQFRRLKKLSGPTLYR